MATSSTLEVVEVEGAKGVLHVVRHGLECDLTQERAGQLFSLGSEVEMSGEKAMENRARFVRFESFKDGRGLW